MADVKDLFEQGEDVTGLFNAGADVNASAPAKPETYSPDLGDVSTGKGLLTGAQKGTTFGFNDELAAISGAVGAKKGGDKRDFMDIYRDILGTVRKEQKHVEEEAPIATLGGELAGGLLTGSMLPIGALGKGASFGSKLGQAAKVGAAYGAISGLGSSEADLTKGQVGQAAKDVAGSAAGGAILGGGLQTLGSGLSALGSGAMDILSSFSTPKDVIETFKKSRAGIELLGKVNEFAGKNKAIASDIIDTLENLRNLSGKFMSGHINEIEATQGKINFIKEVNELQAKAESMIPKSAQEEADINTFKKSLNRLIQRESEKIVSSGEFSKLPSIAPEEQALQKVTKQTAKNATKEKLELNNIMEQLRSGKFEPEQVEGLIARAKKLSEIQTHYPPENLPENITGMNVQAVNRQGAVPIVEPIAPMSQAAKPGINTMSSNISTIGRGELTPTEINDQLIQINAALKGKNISAANKSLLNNLKDILTSKLEQAGQIAGPKGEEAIAGYNAAKNAFGTVAEGQQKLGLPGYFGARTGDEEKATDRLLGYVQQYSKEGSKGKLKLDAVLDDLEKQFPGSSQRLRSMIQEGSLNERLSKELSSTSALSQNPISATAKASSLQTARLLGKSIGAVEAVPATISKKLTDMGKTIYDASPETLQKLADVATSKGKKFGSTIGQMSQAPEAKRRAVLFTLMQQPDFREFIREYTEPKPGETP